jgi:hypothetical protein
MDLKFLRLNDGWNADPNWPDPKVEIQGEDIVLRFYVNAFQFPDFAEGNIGMLRFSGCERFRLGATNDEGWYLGQCRFSGIAPAWGELYQVYGDPALLDAPTDWQSVRGQHRASRHFLFYLRDHTFECAADLCALEQVSDNSLYQMGKVLVPV